MTELSAIAPAFIEMAHAIVWASVATYLVSPQNGPLRLANYTTKGAGMFPPS